LARVTVRLYADLRAVAGKSELNIEANSIRDLIETLIREYGTALRESLLDQHGRLEQFYRVYVNKRLVSEGDVERTVLEDGDVVQMFPPVAGGYLQQTLQYRSSDRRQKLIELAKIL